MVSRRNVMFVALAALLLGAPAFSQAADAGISGMVRDASGAGIPGARVAASAHTGGERSTITATDGSYTLAGLAPGSYTVSAELLGFRKNIQKDVQVAAGATASADFTLVALLQEEITVTAMLREETLANTPFSVAAPTEAVLRARGIDNIEAIAANVAGFSVQNLGPGQSQVAMRGVSAGQIVRDQPGVKEQVGAYLDESTISLSLFTPDMDLFDMARVEVLRGPQGTLFGAGSLSGTLRYISNQPQLGERKVFGEFAGNSIGGGDLGGSAKLGFNAPLGTSAALRVAGFYNRIGGYIDAVQPGGSVNENVNTGERTGVRASLLIKPNDRFSITPRFVYQKATTDGWNRADAYNILANPFTTSRPPVALGEREQFTQIPEPFTDEFTLGDVNLKYDFGQVQLQSITSYTKRDVLVVRDATALTASITGGSIGLPANVFELDAPLDDATKAKVWTEELRFSGGKDKFRWVAGGFYSKTKRDYGQSLLVRGFEDLTGIPTAGRFGAGKDVLFFSDLHYELKQYAAFGEGTYTVSPKVSLTGGLRYYNFTEDRTQAFDGIFADPASKPGTIDANGVAPRLIASFKISDTTNLNAQVSKGFRLGGINDQLNVPLCTPEDLVTFSGRDAWKDEKAWNYEFGTKSSVMGGRGSFNASVFYMDIKDLQATVTAGSCSSRVIFNVPKARSAGVEAEFSAAPNNHFNFSLSGSYNDSQLRSTLTSNGAVVSGIEEGKRLPTVPELQMAAAATYQWNMRSGALGYATATFQYQGSRFTQIGDQADGFGTVNLNSFGANTIGRPLTASTFTFDPELPSYSILNLRLGVTKGQWDVAAYCNNLTDEVALLALDQERGTRARVGYLTNQPRTFGISTRITF